MAADLERLVRWESSGGTWRVLARRPDGLDVALLTCVGDETMDLISSSEPGLLAYVGGRTASDQPTDATGDSAHRLPRA